MDNIAIPQGWVNGLFAALVGGVLWLFRKHDKKIDSIAADYVTRAELTEAIATHNAIVQTMHNDNTRNFSEVRTALAGVNDKLFDLASRIQIK